MKALKHILCIAVGLLVFFVMPGLLFGDLPALVSGGPDAVSGASMEIPDTPSGEYVVLINRDRHSLTMEDWRAFFEERPVGVIMEDISCLLVQGDASGKQLAERYLARLAANQMTLKEENSLLVVSRAENGQFDVVILSKEMADAVDFSAACSASFTETVEVKGGSQ